MRKEWKWIIFYSVTVMLLLLGIKLGSHTVSVLSENQTVERSHCIIIDPGHGGEDGGAVSVAGIPESTYNLAISLRLNDLLNFLGFDTKMTRITDISIYTKGETLSQKKASDLKERVRMVDETDDAVLISIHQNYYSDERYSGAQVFYGNHKDGKVLAEQMQGEFVSALNHNSNRQAKKSSGIFLMEKVACPAVLVECGFLSNWAEESKLRDPVYQKKVSCVVAATVARHLSNT